MVVVESPGDHGAPVVGEEDDSGDLKGGEEVSQGISIRFEAVVCFWGFRGRLFMYN